MVARVKSMMKWLALALALIVFLVPVSAWLQSVFEHREGLEIIAEKMNLSEEKFYKGLFPDYTIPYMENELLSNIVAGVLGLIIITIVSIIVFYSIAKLRG